MKIELTHGYYIEVDSMCHTLKRKRLAKKKNSDEVTEVETVHGYFNSLEQTVKKYLYLKHIDENASTAVTFAEYVNLIAKSNKEAVEGILKALEVSNGKT